MMQIAGVPGRRMVAIVLAGVLAALAGCGGGGSSGSDAVQAPQDAAVSAPADTIVAIRRPGTPAICITDDHLSKRRDANANENQSQL